MKKLYVLMMIVLSSIYCVAAMGSEQSLLQEEHSNYGAIILDAAHQIQSQKPVDYFAELPREIQYKIIFSINKWIYLGVA